MKIRNGFVDYVTGIILKEMALEIQEKLGVSEDEIKIYSGTQYN